MAKGFGRETIVSVVTIHIFMSARMKFNGVRVYRPPGRSWSSNSEELLIAASVGALIAPG